MQYLTVHKRKLVFSHQAERLLRQRCCGPRHCLPPIQSRRFFGELPSLYYCTGFSELTLKTSPTSAVYPKSRCLLCEFPFLYDRTEIYCFDTENKWKSTVYSKNRCLLCEFIFLSYHAEFSVLTLTTIPNLPSIRKIDVPYVSYHPYNIVLILVCSH